MKTTFWMVLVALLAITSTGFSQSGPVNFDSLDQFIGQTMQEWQVPGLAISLVKDGRVIYSKGYGVRDLSSKQPVTTHTLFSLASCSKAFTATAAAMLVQDSLIDWDTPLQSYFPDFAMYDSLASPKVTLRDLLCHRTGVPEQEFFRMNEPPSRREVMRRWRYFEPDQDFRTVWNYNNLGYTIAGTMLAERAGKPWEDLIRTRLLVPLGMSGTLFSVHDVQKAPDYACPHIVYDKDPERMEFYDADVLGPAGCIVSNVDDMSKWLIFNLNKGVVDGKALVSPPLFAEIRKPLIPVPSRGSKEILCPSYGMGWITDVYRGRLRVQHGGLLFGFTALVSTLPSDSIGLVVLTNLNNTPLPTVIEGYLYDRLLGLTPVDWNKRKHDAYNRMAAQEKEAASQPDTLRKPDSPLLHKLGDYAGLYRSRGYGDITVRLDGDSLKAVLTTIECPLNHYRDETFELYHRVKRASWNATFHSDSSGRVSSFSVQISPTVKDIVFERVSGKENPD